MESYSSGRFHEYNPPQNESQPMTEGGGLVPKTDVCDRVIESARIEEVERTQYHKRHFKVPMPGDKVKLRNALENGRLVIEHVESNLSIGYLPTRFNYLAQCLASGKKYGGKVTASANSPSARIVIELVPS